MSSALQSISWIPATNNFYQEDSGEPFHKLPHPPSLFRQNRLMTCYGRLTHLTCNISLFFVVVVGARVGLHMCGMFWGGTVSAMRVRIVMTCFRAAQDTL